MRISDWSADVCSPALIDILPSGSRETRDSEHRLAEKRPDCDAFRILDDETIGVSCSQPGGAFVLIRVPHDRNPVFTVLDELFESTVVQDRKSTRLNSSH